MSDLFRKPQYRIICIGLLSVFLLSGFSYAQYFGQNKVQYESFDFKVMHTEHFDVYFYPEEEESALIAARMAERWYARLSRMLGHELRGKQPLILYSSSAHFQQTTTISGTIGEGTGGVTEMFKRRIILPIGATLAETDHVIGHELVHAFQYDITTLDYSGYISTPPGVARLPLWLVEGMAEYLSIGPADPHTSMWMRDAVKKDKLPTIKKLIDPRYFPYRYGQSLWAYITGEWGDSAVAAIIKSAGRTGDYESAIQRVTGLNAEQLSEKWHASMKAKYAKIETLTAPPEEQAQLLFQGTRENPLNISPSFSPDGSRLVFLSTKDLFSIDMYLADAKTGEIIRKLVKTAMDPHFESLQFIKSSGGWDSTGDKFAFGAIVKGEPVLTIMSIQKGNKIKEIVFPDLGEILNPSWSPDNKKIVFSALEGGFSDLFIYDIEDDELKKITDDPYGDLYPAWSPDGKYIAFSTERYSSDLSLIDIGNYELALLNPENDEVEKIGGWTGAKNLNPQWAPDSESLYFVSDKNGITNVYRIEVDSREISQITNLYSGVSGITSISPAISMAQEIGRLAFCMYKDGNYNIYTIDIADVVPTETAVVDFGGIHPEMLPPREKPEGELLGLLNNPLYGLPEEKEYEIADYKPKLKLDYVSPPQFAIGTDRFGTYAGGGVALYFSDMLGYHNVVGMGQVNGSLIDSAVLLGYQNSRNRFNWGGVVQRIPYVYGGYQVSLGEFMGEPVFEERDYIYRQINYEVSGFASYPFSRVNRFELSAGYRYLDFDSEIRTRVYSAITGFLYYRDKEKLPSPDGIHFGFGSAALVYDTSFFGATGPILGQSYRLETSPYFGTINFTNVLADYRRYIMPVRPYTLAFRFLHFGRYGSGAEDRRLYPLFLGYETLVRGYNPGSFRAEEFQDGKEFAYDSLFGSKIIVINAELRFPLFGVLGIGRGYYGVFPIDFITFFDTGIAWTNENKPWFSSGERRLLSSTGVGIRINLFGAAVLGLNLVKPLDRPERGPYLQLSFMPGF